MSSDGDDAGVSRTIVLESRPTVIDVLESPFAHEVVTTLPYRDVTSTETFPYFAVMIDEDCILGCIHVRVMLFYDCDGFSPRHHRHTWGITK